MLSQKQESEIIKRVTATLVLFFENDCLISNKNLAELLALQGIKSSSSTVDRDLTSSYAEDIIGKEKMEIVKNFKKLNKTLGQHKGGEHSAFNNDIIKDEEGHFKGSTKRHG